MCVCVCVCVCVSAVCLCLCLYDLCIHNISFCRIVSSLKHSVAHIILKQRALVVESSFFHQWCNIGSPPIFENFESNIIWAQYERIC